MADRIRESWSRFRERVSATWWFWTRIAKYPLPNSEYWKVLIGSASTIEGRVMQQIRARLAARHPGPRNHGADDTLFSPLANATVVAIAYDNYQLAIDMFYSCYQLARDYEATHGVEVHKGAMTFNVAIAFLRSHDFSAAMHYFELSKYETEMSYGHTNWDIFSSDLFGRNYWNLIDLFEQGEPLSLYQQFWSVRYGKVAANDDWQALSEHSKLLYIVTGAERIRYLRLKSQPPWNGADSVGLSYWNLIADQVRLLETEIRQLGFSGRGLNDMVLNQINNSPVPNFKANVHAFRAAHPIHDPTSFNAHFSALRSVIENPAERPEMRIACAAYLAGSARNQVQHQVDTGMVIYADRSAAVVTANAFLSLCRLRDWVA